MWEPITRDLSSHYTCILIDLPGYGDNKDIDFSSIKSVAHEINKCLIQITPEPITIFGHSMGGYIALEMVSESEGLFNGLGLMHSTAKSDTPKKKESRDKAIQHLLVHPKKQYLRSFTKSLVSSRNLEALEDQLNNLVDSTERHTIIACLKAMKERENHLDLLAKTKLPIFFGVGKYDEFISPRQSFYEASLCTQSYVAYMSEVGHLAPLEDKKKCLIFIRHFLYFLN